MSRNKRNCSNHAKITADLVEKYNGQVKIDVENVWHERSYFDSRLSNTAPCCGTRYDCLQRNRYDTHKPNGYNITAALHHSGLQRLQVITFG